MAAITGAVIAGATLVNGVVQSNRARGDARSAQRSQENAASRQADIAEDQLEFGREQYSDWRNTFQPALNDLRTMAYEEQRPDYLGIAGDVANTFDTSQAANRRTMQRYGISPKDGASGASETQYGIGRALATVGGFQQARNAAKDNQWNRLASFANLSNGQQANAQNTMNQGFGALGNAFGNQANMFGSQAAGYGQAAAAGAQMAGYGLNQLQNFNWGSFGGGAQPMPISPVQRTTFPIAPPSGG